MFVKHQETIVKEINHESFAGMDIVFFSAGTNTSRHFVASAVRAGALVIDNAVAGTDDCYVGYLRKDSAFKNGLAMWLVADNIRKGAALNAVRMSEEIIKRDWFVHGG
jgi:aspartate-semialdehyde dehydrogenase